MWHCRGLVYLFLMAISHRFALEMSSSLQDFLVEVVPVTLTVSGIFPVNAPLSVLLDFSEVK